MEILKECELRTCRSRSCIASADQSRRCNRHEQSSA